MDRRVISEARRLRDAWSKFHASQPHFRMPLSHATGGVLSCSLSLSEAIEAAKAIVRGRDEGLSVTWDDDDLPWDGECEAPRHVLCGTVYAKDDNLPLASIGGVGVDHWNDPYLDILGAELLQEAFDYLDAERDRKASMQAVELAERATYAAGG